MKSNIDDSIVKQLVLFGKEVMLPIDGEDNKDCDEERNLYKDKAENLIIPCLNEDLFLVDIAKQELRYKDPFYIGSNFYDPIDYLKEYASNISPVLLEKLSDKEYIMDCIEQQSAPLHYSDLNVFKETLFKKQYEEVELCNEAVARDKTLKSRMESIKERNGGRYLSDIIMNYNAITNKLNNKYGNSENPYYEQYHSRLLRNDTPHFHIRSELFPVILTLSISNANKKYNMMNNQNFKENCDKAEQLIKEAGFGNGYAEDLGVGLGEYLYSKDSNDDEMEFEFCSPEGQVFQASYYKDFDEAMYSHGYVMGDTYEKEPEEWLDLLSKCLKTECLNKNFTVDENKEKSLSEEIFDEINSKKEESLDREIEEGRQSFGLHR